MKPYIWMDGLGTTISPEAYETLDANLKDGLFPLFTGLSIASSFEDGRQQGMKQEHALWKLANGTNELSASNYDSVTRVEVIDENGRSYSGWHTSISYISLQDENKTLKIFLAPRRNGEE